MDIILENFRHNLSACEVEYRVIEGEFSRLVMRRDYLDSTRNNIMKLIEERETFLNQMYPENLDSVSETHGTEILKFEWAFANVRNQSETTSNDANNELSQPDFESMTEISCNLQPRFEQITYGVFTGAKLIDAVIKYLRIMKTGQSTRQIAEALLIGGYQTTAQDFTDTVRSTLKQYKSPKGPVIWVNNRWELREWIPLSD